MLDKTISVNKSIIIKFVAVCLMICLHLFSNMNSNDYISVLRIGQIPIEYYIANFSTICVGIFVFISGYGLSIKYCENVTYKKMFNKIIKFYLNFWIIFIIFIPLGFILGKLEFSYTRIILNFFAITSDYSYEWWFATFYIMILLLFPIICKLIKKYNYKLIILLSFILNIIGMGIVKLYIAENITFIPIRLLGTLLSQIFIFVLAMCIAKYGLFDKLNKKIKNSKGNSFIIFIISSLIILFFNQVPVIGEILKIVIVPLFVFGLANMIKENKLLIILGKQSTNIWLIHTFFTHYYFSEIIHMPKLSILIYIFTIIITLIASVIINQILRIIELLINKLKYKSKNIIKKEK